MKTAAAWNGLEPYIRRRLSRKPLLLMAHAIAGYPCLDANRAMLEAMDASGVDLVELQLPFSEPIADGPVFVRANQEAIDRGMRWDDYFELLSWASSRCSFPTLFMGYYNSVYRMGADAFCRRLAAAGARGFILADLPPEEGRALNERGRSSGLDPILIMTPSSGEERLGEIASQASGLVYCVARKGVTGRHTDLSSGVEDFLARVRRATRLPLGLGFGLKTPEDVRGVRGKAEVAIVGTACLEAWELEGREGYRRFLADLVAETGPTPE
jgi:tryptophan synthase alpha chain